MNSNRLYLVPINVVDLVGKLLDANIGENERYNYEIRVEAIREYCDFAINKHNSNKNSKKFQKVNRK